MLRRVVSSYVDRVVILEHRNLGICLEILRPLLDSLLGFYDTSDNVVPGGLIKDIVSSD